MSENSIPSADANANGHIVFEDYRDSKEPSIRSDFSNFTSMSLRTIEEIMELDIQLKALEDFLKPSWGIHSYNFKNIKKYLIEFHLKEIKDGIQLTKENQLENKSLFKHFKIKLSIDIINLMNYDPIIGNKFICPKYNSNIQELARLNTIVIVRDILKSDQLFVEHIEIDLKSDISNFFKVFEIEDFSTLSTVTRIKNKTNEFSLIEGVLYDIMEPQAELISTDYQCTNYKCTNQNYLHVKYLNNLAIVIKRNNLNMFQPLTTKVALHDIDLKCLSCNKEMLESCSDRVYNIFQYGTLITSRLENYNLYENHVKILFEGELVGSARCGDELVLLGYAFREKEIQKNGLNSAPNSDPDIAPFIRTTLHILDISLVSLSSSKFDSNQNPLNVLTLTNEYSNLIKNIFKFKASSKRVCQISSSIKNSLQENIFNGYYEVIILKLSYLDKPSLKVLLENLKEYQLQSVESKNFVIWAIFDLSVMITNGSSFELECIPEKYYEVIEYFNIAQYIKSDCDNSMILDNVLGVLNNLDNNVMKKYQNTSLDIYSNKNFEQVFKIYVIFSKANIVFYRISEQARIIFQNYFLLLKEKFKQDKYFRNLDSTITLRSLKAICQAITMINMRSIPNLFDIFERRVDLNKCWKN
ncbi:hypothetical protein CONCODRAFT_2806 [Conidiobolus coronatus NRRL 28638]|uniref:Uncharacterized protein n=1 Tax=Conidiobolus coronatus (strain ATCC 28846 / CBS 209.66 / NRRL 28638) TaxID=796925 RepID=A0A137PGI4_CONC2|nr:hypothetical protein CONCODRAFT_2806 [Conidiobolus coronatus NRRL 28638]|eukprot:KXN74102.1 hypothetical protein CONCODRAFT_2806 [Conidiobolus coronatus NRRL 28638]